MSYDTERQKVGRRPCVIVKLALDSGDVWISQPRDGIPPSIDGEPVLPVITGVDLAPTRITPGKGLGYLGKISIKLRDTPLEVGSFWGRLVASDPYWLGREMTAYVGYIGDTFDLADFEPRLFLLEEIDGPDSKGNVSITGKDPLALITDERAVAPAADSTKLDADITAGATSMTIAPAGSIATWSTSGHVRIGSEIIQYASITGDDLTGLTRGKFSTEAEEHSEDDAVQRCIVYDNERLDDLLFFLLADYSGVPEAYLPMADWVAECNMWLNTDRFDRVISEPTPVRELIDDLLNSSLTYLWWDERAQEIKLKAVAPSIEDAGSISDTYNIRKDSQTIKRDMGDQATRVIVYYDQINPVEDNKPSNFRQIYIAVSDGEDASKYGRVRAKSIFCPWLGNTGSGSAARIANRTLGRYKDGVPVYGFQLDVGDATDLWTGDVVSVSSRVFQDENGERITKRMLIIEAEEVDGTYRKYLAQEDIFQAGRYGFIGPNDLPDYLSATEQQKRSYAWFCGEDGLMSNGDEGYKFI